MMLKKINNEIILQIIGKILKEEKIPIQLLQKISYNVLYYIIINHLSYQYEGCIYVETNDILKFFKDLDYNFDKEYIFIKQKRVEIDRQLEMIITEILKKEVFL